MNLKREAATSHKAFQEELCACEPCCSEWPSQKFVQLSICQLQARRRPGAKQAPGNHPTRWGPIGQTSVKLKKSSKIHQTQRPLQEKRLPPCMRHFRTIHTCMEAITFRMNFIQHEFHWELSSHPHANSGLGGGLGPSGRQTTTQTSEGYQVQTPAKLSDTTAFTQTLRPLQKERLPPCMRFLNTFPCMEATIFRMNFARGCPVIHMPTPSWAVAWGQVGAKPPHKTSEGHQGRPQRNSVTQQHLLNHRGPYREWGCHPEWDISKIYFHARKL